MYRPDLPKLYHLENDEDPSQQLQKLKVEEKKKNKLNNQPTKISSTSKLTSIMNDSKEDSELNQIENNYDDNCLEINSIENDSKNLENLNDISFNLNEQETESLNENLNDTIDKNVTKDSILNVNTLIEIINELKNNKSRVTKISLEKFFKKRNDQLSRNEINDFFNECLENEVLEKARYRDYYGYRIKASFKSSLKNAAVSDKEQVFIEDINDKSTIDQDSSMIPDNISESSSNLNLTNDDDLKDLDNEFSFSTKRASIKRVTPNIRYLLRNAPSEGISASKMLKTLQSKRLLILYNIKKFNWLIKKYFVERGICEKLSNGNYKLAINDDEDSSNNSTEIKLSHSSSNLSTPVKNQAFSELNKNKGTEEIDLLADEKFSDIDNQIDDTTDDKKLCKKNLKETSDQESDEEVFVKDISKKSETAYDYLSIELINEVLEILNKGCLPTNIYKIKSILEENYDLNLSQTTLVKFLDECEMNNNLEMVLDSNLDKTYSVIQKQEDALSSSSAKEEELISNELIKKLTPFIKNLFKSHKKNSSISADTILKHLQSKNFFVSYDLVKLNKFIKEEMQFLLLEMPKNCYKLLNESINDKIINSSTFLQPINDKDSDQSNDKINIVTKSHNLKRKIKNSEIVSESSTFSLNKKTEDATQRRPFSQRKKIKKSLGPDFLDPSGLKYQHLKSAYEEKCDSCSSNNTSKKLINCQKCKFKIHQLCLKDYDLIYYEINRCKFECKNCRLSCFHCDKEDEKLISQLKKCSKCKIEFHIDCLKKSKHNPLDCSECWKIINSEIKEDHKKINSSNKVESIQNDPKITNNLENLTIDLNDTLSNDINVKSDLLQEVPSLIQLKELEMTNVDKILSNSNSFYNNKNENFNKKVNFLKKMDQKNFGMIKEFSFDEFLNDDSNQSNCLSSLVSTNSNIDSLKKSKEDTLVQKYRKFFKAYDVQQEIKISEEHFNALRLLNTYSNGKNPVDWTVEDVETFICDIGFPEQSSYFRKEEIDGKSLLLLRRTDVLTGLSMRLGPALKIYAHIYKLQGSI